MLVVTHLPQIACFADLHVRVRKHDGDATAQVLDDDERPVELSRMLAGMEASEHALSHAEELLDEAARVSGRGVVNRRRGAAIADGNFLGGSRGRRPGVCYSRLPW